VTFRKGYVLADPRDGVAAVGYPPQARLDGPAAMTRFHARPLTSSSTTSLSRCPIQNMLGVRRSYDLEVLT
jgi:hypothetical protein